jgi:hypothetical protein
VIVEEARSIDLQRRFIASAEQAQNHAIDYCRRRAIPGLRGSVAVRPARAAALRAGQHIRLDIDPEPGGLRLEKVCRILRIERPATGPVTLDVEGERTLAPVAFVEPTLPSDPAELTVPDIVHARLFEVPPPLAGDLDFHLGILAERPGDVVTDCTVLYDTDDETDATFPPLGAHRAYALRARLTQSYGSAPGDPVELEIEVLSPRDRELVSVNPGLVAARNDTLLLIAFGSVDTSGGGYRLPYEIFSISEFVSTGPNLLQVAALRARLGTAPLAHAINAECWVIPRETLPIYTHRDFPGKAGSAALSYFKLQPSTFFAVRPLADVAVRSFRFDSSRVYAPQITITGPANDAGKDYVSLATGGSLTFTGNVADLDGNLVAVRIHRANPDGSQDTLMERNLAPTAAMSFSQPATFAQDGNSIVTIQAEDSSLRVVQRQVRVLVGTAISGKLLPPTGSVSVSEEYYDDPGYFSYNIFYDFYYPEAEPGGSDLRIDWFFTDKGVSYVSPTTTGYSTGFAPVSGNYPEESFAYTRRFWARCRDANSVYTNSDWVFFDVE